jgi:hypothetical protein
VTPCTAPPATVRYRWHVTLSPLSPNGVGETERRCPLSAPASCRVRAEREARAVDFPEFDHLPLADLREMMRQLVAAAPPPERDREFIRRLALAIGEREKTFGRERSDPRSAP